MKKILILILILIMLIILKNKKENYDLIARNIINIEKCGDISSSIYGIGGFAYNPENKNCYISKTQLTYPREFLKSNLVGMDLLISDSLPALDNSPYYNLSKQNDIICNKRQAILNQKDIQDNNMIDNRIYECNHNEYSTNRNAKTTYYFQKNKPKKEITLQCNNILPITYHNFFCIDSNDITRPTELRELNVLYGQRHTTRDTFGEKIINGPADNLFISLYK